MARESGEIVDRERGQKEWLERVTRVSGERVVRESGERVARESDLREWLDRVTRVSG